MTKVFKKESEVAWENHFMVDGAKLQWLYTKEKDDSPITVMKVLLQEGVTLPDHRHPDQPDLIYPLKGKATMFIEGEGEFPLEPGMVVQVPQNALHAIRRVEEELLLLQDLVEIVDFTAVLHAQGDVEAFTPVAGKLLRVPLFLQ